MFQEADMAMTGFPRADRKIPSMLEEDRILEHEEREAVQEFEELERRMSDWENEDEDLFSPFAVRTNPTPEDLSEVSWFYYI
jgi:hypothetical protein